MPVVVPFFQSNGLNQTQIFALQAVYSAAVIVLEVPSGYFADRFGRKLAILAGSVLVVAGYGVYSLARGFWPMAVAEVVLGVGFSLFSGADDALALNSLKAHPSIDTAARYLARTFRYRLVGSMLASVLGGLVALYSLRAVPVAQMIVFAPLIPMAWALKEVPGSLRVAKHNAFRDAWRIIKYCLHGHREIKWLIFYGALVSTITYSMLWLAQPYYQLLGIPLGLFGLLWAIQYALTAGMTGLVSWVGKLSRRVVLVAFLVLGVGGCLVLGLWPSVWALVAFAGFWFIRALSVPMLKDYINQLVESDVRATVLSTSNLVARAFGVAVTLGVLGHLVDRVSLPAALLAAAAIFGLCGLVILTAMNRAKLL